MKNEKNILWDNDVDAEFDAIAKAPIEFGLNDTDADAVLWQAAQDRVDQALDDLVDQCDVDVSGEIFLIGTLQKWDSSHEVFESLDTKNLGKALCNAMLKFKGDNSFEIYLKDNHLYLSQRGQDNPVNPTIMEFRVARGQFVGGETKYLKKSSMTLGKKIQDALGINVKKL